MYLEEKAIK